MKENAYVAEVMRAVGPLEGGYFYRNNTGGAWIRDRYVTFGDPGSGDIIGAFLGRAVAIECKSATGRQSDVQKGWQASWEAAGGLYVLPRRMRTPAAAAAYVLEQMGVKPDHPRRPTGRVIHRDMSGLTDAVRAKFSRR